MPYPSLVDRIVDELRLEILKGSLGPEQRLPPERKLCAAFGVGRTTVREAPVVLYCYSRLKHTEPLSRHQ